MDLDVPPLECCFFVFRNCLTQTLTLTLDLGHRVRAKWDEGPSLTPTNFTAMRFLRYNSAGLHFQESRVVLNDSAFKNGWGIVLSNISGINRGLMNEKPKKHICMHRFVCIDDIVRMRDASLARLQPSSLVPAKL